MIGIAIQDTLEKALAFADRFGKAYFLALENAAGDIGLDYRFYAVRQNFFIDPDACIQENQSGARSPDR